MLQVIRFHLDEHIDPAIAAGLRNHGIDVTTAAHAGLLGASDEEHISSALSQDRVIVWWGQTLFSVSGAKKRAANKKRAVFGKVFLARART